MTNTFQYSHNPIRVLFLTLAGVSMTTPANVGQGSVIFAQARMRYQDFIFGRFLQNK
jgi:hypothetical protein